MTLADTSVWVDHLDHGDPVLHRLLTQDLVITHPFVVGELAMGNLRDRQKLLGFLQLLPTATRGLDSEVLAFVEKHALFGLGIGTLTSTSSSLPTSHRTQPSGRGISDCSKPHLRWASLHRTPDVMSAIEDAPLGGSRQPTNQVSSLHV